MIINDALTLTEEVIIELWVELLALKIDMRLIILLNITSSIKSLSIISLLRVIWF